MLRQSYIEGLKRTTLSREAEFFLNAESFKSAWDTCQSGMMLLCIAEKTVDLKKLTLAKMKLVELVQHEITDKKLINLIDIARKFISGCATVDDLKKAGKRARRIYIELSEKRCKRSDCEDEKQRLQSYESSRKSAAAGAALYLSPDGYCNAINLMFHIRDVLSLSEFEKLEAKHLEWIQFILSRDEMAKMDQDIEQSSKCALT